jgi:hypothetical protein
VLWRLRGHRRRAVSDLLAVQLRRTRQKIRHALSLARLREMCHVRMSCSCSSSRAWTVPATRQVANQGELLEQLTKRLAALEAAKSTEAA